MAIPGKIVPVSNPEGNGIQPGSSGCSEMLGFSDRVAVPQHVLVRHLDGETVLLNLDTEKYFGLDATGTRMWQLATLSPDVETAFVQLIQEFEVEADLLRTHLSQLLEQLVDNGLLQVVPADVDSIPAI